MIFGERNDQDTSGAMSYSRPIDIDIYVLVFDVLCDASFESVTRSMAKIKAARRYASDREMCVLLVGAQCDRISSRDEVAFGAYLALKAKTSAFSSQYDCPYVECSALQNVHIEELFDVAVKEAIMYKGERMYNRF